MKVMEHPEIDFTQPHVRNNKEKGKPKLYKSITETKEKVEQLLEAFPPLDPNNKFACYYIYSDSAYSDIARAVEYDVFREAFGDGPNLMAQEYLNYEDHSIFVLVIDREERLAAASARIIENSSAGLKTLVDIAQPPLSITPEQVKRFHKIDSLDNCWDSATAAVIKKYRAHTEQYKVGLYLYHLVHKQSIKFNIEHHVSIMDKGIYSQLVRFIGAPYVPIMDSSAFNYLGSKSSLAVYGKISEFFPSIYSRKSTLSPRALKTLGPYIDCICLGDGIPTLQEVHD